MLSSLKTGVMQFLCITMLTAGVAMGHVTGWNSPPCCFALVTGVSLLIFTVICAYPKPFDALACRLDRVGEMLFMLGVGLSFVAIVEMLTQRVLMFIFPAGALLLVGFTLVMLARLIAFVSGNKIQT